MISKERLEELIEQGATIYSNEYGEIQLIKENDLSLYENGQNNYILYALEPNKKYHNEIFDEDLFETEEEAKWFAEFGCIERTERLELPTWEEIENDFIIHKQSGGNYCVREFFGKEQEYSLDIVVWNGEVMVSISDEDFCKPLTKENYTLACRKAKELFLGEKK